MLNLLNGTILKNKTKRKIMKTQNNNKKELIRETIDIAIHDFNTKWSSYEEKENGIDKLTDSLFKNLAL